MRTIKSASLIMFVTLLTSCVSTTQFPISRETPAAKISIKVKKISSQNYYITIIANSLAASERLSPPKQTYVIWAVSDVGIIRNAGNFTEKNAITRTFKASFPYKLAGIFITAEDEGGTCEPEGAEITRIKF